eukprot:6188402-Pleurochrysis_carterae.AAC.1
MGTKRLDDGLEAKLIAVGLLAQLLLGGSGNKGEKEGERGVERKLIGGKCVSVCMRECINA